LTDRFLGEDFEWIAVLVFVAILPGMSFAFFRCTRFLNWRKEEEDRQAMLKKLIDQYVKEKSK
jgi:hypothetical protein